RAFEAAEEDGVAMDGEMAGTSAPRTTIGRDRNAMGEEGLTCYRACLEAACGDKAGLTNRSI
ncbi:hypothetical protein PENTCL1PPCAC_14059, partial [Pristionchus entomophagus]